MTVLINLISDEVIPNALAIKKIKPKHLVNLYTGDIYHEKMNYLNKFQKKLVGESEVTSILVKHNEPADIRQKIGQIAGNLQKDIVINVTGGTKLMAFGAFQAGLELDLPVMYIDPEEGRYKQLAGKRQNWASHALEKLSIDNFFILSGTRVRSDDTGIYQEYQKQLSQVAHWARHNPTAWLELIGYLEAAFRNYRNKQDFMNTNNLTEFQVPMVMNHPNQQTKMKYHFPQQIFWLLRQLGLLDQLKIAGREVYFRFPGAEVKNVLCRKGFVLEFLVYELCRHNQHVDEVRSGIEVDWPGEQQVNNEIDVLVLTGHKLWLISCKMGKFNKDHLAELSINARLLGGIKTGKILVAPANSWNDQLLERAELMGIKYVYLEELEKLHQIIKI